MGRLVLFFRVEEATSLLMVTAPWHPAEVGTICRALTPLGLSQGAVGTMDGRLVWGWGDAAGLSPFRTG